MTRNWKLGEPGWCWPDDVDETGTETRSGSRYLPLINTDDSRNGYSWTVAKIFVDEDDPDMFKDARLIEAAPDLLVACKLAVKWLKELSNDVDAETDLIDVLEAIDKAEGNT